MPLPSWNERQKDFANYFNPAFIGLIVYGIVKGYNSKTGRGMPLAIVFPSVVMILHPEIRKAIPRTTRAHFSKWLRENPELRSNLLSSTLHLVPQIKEALLMSLRSKWIISESGLLVAQEIQLSNLETPNIFYKDLKLSEFIGRWLANAGGDVEIYQQIGATT